MTFTHLKNLQFSKKKKLQCAQHTPPFSRHEQLNTVTILYTQKPNGGLIQQCTWNNKNTCSSQVMMAMPSARPIVSRKCRRLLLSLA